jgi:hypothetical protein
MSMSSWRGGSGPREPWTRKRQQPDRPAGPMAVLPLVASLLQPWTAAALFAPVTWVSLAHGQVTDGASALVVDVHISRGSPAVAAGAVIRTCWPRNSNPPGAVAEVANSAMLIVPAFGGREPTHRWAGSPVVTDCYALVRHAARMLSS